jgi:23S rRNA (cytosine1962-C5)-methyltransferase
MMGENSNRLPPYKNVIISADSEERVKIFDNGYCVLDSGNGKKLEQVGPFRIVRPAAGAVWNPRQANWKNIDASFERFSGGDGRWTINNPKFKSGCHVKISGITFKLEPTDFGHIGIFAEQHKNWLKINELISSRDAGEFNTINLFAYTGGSSMAAALAGSRVTHVDASKTSVSWARENMKLSSPDEEKPVRWIVEDVQKYIAREVKRGSKYQGIILDPPTFGRGIKGELWKIEDHAMPLLEGLKAIAAKDLKFVLLSSHSPGYTAIAMENMIKQVFGFGGDFLSEEMVLPMAEQALPLPTGAYSLMVRS